MNGSAAPNLRRSRSQSVLADDRQSQRATEEGRFYTRYNSMASLESSSIQDQRGFMRPRRRALVPNAGRTATPCDKNGACLTPQTDFDGEDSTPAKTMSTSTGYLRRLSLPYYSANPKNLFPTDSHTNQNELPSLTVVFVECIVVPAYVCSLYCLYAFNSLKKPYRRFRQIVHYLIIIAAVVLLVLLSWMVVDFYQEAVQICTPPPDYGYVQERPLVEYYVHGRGIGHYARSVAIVDRLNKAGVDVRMFLTRAAMWRALHEDLHSTERSAMVGSGGEGNENMGTTTAISVTSLTPALSIFETISHIVERIIGDCEVSTSSGNYPNLVIADGDLPGMLRAEFGGIPSVGIAHGQLFRIAQKPDWVESVPHLNDAWNSQGRLNGASSYFSEWQIATHFCFLESRVKSGVVARAPLRPEVLQMGVARKLARDGQTYSNLAQLARVKTLLGLDPAADTGGGDSGSQILPKERRKLVICYFRDRNGDMVVQALLDAGLDVLLFDNGYNKEMIHDPRRYGMQWLVQDHERKGRIRLLNPGKKTSEVDGSVVGGLRKSGEAIVPSSLSKSFGRGSSYVEGSPGKRPGEASRARLIRVTDRSLFVPLMHVADGVASSAGSQLMSECIYAQMPLLALYINGDSEQELNVELSRHQGPCHQPEVFGTSFEKFEAGLQMTGSGSRYKLEELDRFVARVEGSRVSQTFYQNHHWLGKTQAGSKEMDASSVHPEDPFRGLPDAEEIILEIVKQVVGGQ